MGSISEALQARREWQRVYERVPISDGRYQTRMGPQMMRELKKIIESRLKMNMKFVASSYWNPYRSEVSREFCLLRVLIRRNPTFCFPSH